MKPTFIFCFGAQKAGTTWLYRHFLKNNLINHTLATQDKSFIITPEKEMHAAHGRLAISSFSGHRLKRLRRDIDDFLVNNLKLHDKAAALKRIKKSLYLADCALYESSYIEHFKNLYAQNPLLPVGDFTPNYASWDESDLFALLKLVASNGFQIKAIYLLRDPIERIFSWCKHKTERLELHHDYRKISAAEAFWKSLNNPNSWDIRQSHYEEIIPKLDRVFSRLSKEDKGNLHSIQYFFYEDLFNQKTLDRISIHLNCNRARGAFDTRVNADPKRKVLTEEMIKAARPNFYWTYKYVEAKMKYLPQGWHRG